MRRTFHALAAIAVVFALPGLAQAQSPDVMAQGATLYGQHCSRCHNPRAATERSDREWLAIMGHMRVRAMLSRSQTKAVLAFLQATNGMDSPAVAATPSIRVEASDAPTTTVPGQGTTVSTDSLRTEPGDTLVVKPVVKPPWIAILRQLDCLPIP